MNTIEQTEAFAVWFGKLRDDVAKKQIAKRIVFAEADYLPDVKSVGDRVSEMRIHVGPGYRVYFTRKGGMSSSCSRVATSRRRHATSSRRGRWRY